MTPPLPPPPLCKVSSLLPQGWGQKSCPLSPLPYPKTLLVPPIRALFPKASPHPGPVYRAMATNHNMSGSLSWWSTVSEILRLKPRETLGLSSSLSPCLSLCHPAWLMTGLWEYYTFITEKIKPTASGSFCYICLISMSNLLKSRWHLVKTLTVLLQWSGTQANISKTPTGDT